MTPDAGVIVICAVPIFWMLLIISDRLRQIDQKLGKIQNNTFDPERERRKRFDN